MEDFATMDTGTMDAEFTDIGSTETGLQTTDTDSQVIDATPVEGEAPETALTTTGGQQLTSAPGQLSKATSEALSTIKATNPALASSLTKAVHTFDALRREFPGGLKEVRGYKQRVESLGSDQEFEQAQQELVGYREMDSQYASASPKFIETMVKFNPESFQKLAPAMLQKFAEMNPEGYGSLMAQAMVKDMTDSRFTGTLDLLSFTLTDLGQVASDNPAIANLQGRAIKLFNEAVTFIQGKYEQSKKQISAPEAKPDTKSAEIQQREMALTRKEWSADTGKALAQLYQAELNRLSAGRRFTAEQRADILERFQMRLQKALSNTDGYEVKVNGYLASGDRQGNLRYQNSLYATQVPRILAALIKPAQTPAPAAARATPAPVTPSNGAQFVAKEPGNQEINWQKTSMAMIEKNQAILTSGQKVQWR